MNNRQTNEFYNIYPKYWKDYSREYINKIGKCENCGKPKSKKIILTCAHLDQDPTNNAKENIKILCRSCHIQYDQSFHVFSIQTMNKKVTDNSYLKEKIELRLESLNLIKKGEINILEAFAGDGIVWQKVQNITNKKLNILKIDIKNGKKGVYLIGDNRKFIPLFKFENYDIIDLDAYGIPFYHLEVIFKKKYKGIVHVTAIQSGMGRLPNGLLKSLGYSKNMIKKIPTLFNRNGLDKLKNYLYLNGIKEIKGYFINRKNYFYFLTNP